MLTLHWLNDWTLTAVAAVCAVLMRKAGVDAGMPNTNEDFVLY